jgi:Ca2+-binding RTX toxin-like protein
VVLDHSVFSSLSHIGTLPDANFLVRGTAMQDGHQVVIYDPGSGGLFYDADGNGAGTALPFATVTAGLALQASDFIVI